MQGKQPHIDLSDVQEIKVPALVLGTDEDVIKEEYYRPGTDPAFIVYHL